MINITSVVDTGIEPACQIQWIDENGHTTADPNPSIGRCRTKSRVDQVNGRGVNMPGSPWFCICAQHAKKLGDPGMHIWEFERAWVVVDPDTQKP